jgi:hypothetical protein
VQVVPDTFDWEISFSTFSRILYSMPDSAPGPDGVPYSAWARADDHIAQHLFQYYCEVLEGKPLPDNFNHGNVVFIPKGDYEGDDIQIRRAPGDTRPISLSNTDNKLLAAILNHKLTALASATVTQQQRGFVRGRSLVDNVLEIEALAVHIHKYYNEKAGIALFDFSAAFPSLSHKWLFAVLTAMRIPSHIISVLRQLYSHCRMDIVFGGISGYSIDINAGIKQGCPASGSLFALALDPFLRFVLQRIPMRLSTLVAFADDLAAVLLHLRQGLRLLQPLFALLFRAAGLAINPKKTVIVPLGASSAFEVQRYLHDCLPVWSAIRIGSSGKLLGIWLGPSAADTRWRDVIDKFSARAHASKATHYAFEETLRHYRVHTFPVLSHVCQFDAAPAAALIAEDRALQGLTRGPHEVFPQGSLASLCTLGFRFEAPDLAITNRAAMLRTALNSKQFERILAEWDSDPADDEARLVPRRDQWIFETCIANLVANYRSHFNLARQICNSDQSQGHGMQAAISSALRLKAPDLWPALLLRCIQRWLPAARPNTIRLVIDRIRRACALLPHAIVFEWLRGFLNGMPSVARNQQTDSPCILCGSANDRLEHTVHCSALLQLVGESFPLLHRAQGPVLRWEMLTLSAASLSDIGIRESIVFLAVVIFIHNAFYHGTVVSAYEIGQARLRYLRLRDSRV